LWYREGKEEGGKKAEGKESQEMKRHLLAGGLQCSANKTARLIFSRCVVAAVA